MNSVTKWFKEQAKTVAAFVATFVGNMIVSLLDGSTALPQNREEWTQYLLTSAGAAIAAWSVRNKITQKQIDKDPNVVGGIVVDDPAKPVLQSATPSPASGPYTNPFPEPTL
jgi:hypothetical protein